MNLLKLTILMGSTAFSANAVTILSTDFDGSTPNGTTLDSITYTTNGVVAPGSLTVNNTNLVLGDGNLFTSTAAAGHLAVSNNIGQGGTFEVDIPIMLTGNDILLTSATLAITQFSGTGGLQTGPRVLDYSVTITETLSGSQVGSVTTTINATPSDSATLSFGAGILLDSTLDYTFTLSTDNGGNVQGVNTGFDSFSFDGTIIVPEPSSTALLALGGLALLRRKR